MVTWGDWADVSWRAWAAFVVRVLKGVRSSSNAGYLLFNESR